MTIPNLPTDTLYKFMAIFGLILYGFSYYLEFNTNQSLDSTDEKVFRHFLLRNQLGNQWRDQVKINRMSWIEYLIDDVWKPEGFNRGMNLDSLRSLDKWQLSNQGDELVNASMNLDSLGNVIEELYGEGEILYKQQTKERTRLVELLQLTNDLRFYAKILMGFGFLLWYFLSQRIIDAERRVSLQLLREKLNNTKNLDEPID